MELYFEKTVELDEKLKTGQLTAADIERLREIKDIDSCLRVPYKKMPRASAVINEIIHTLNRNKQPDFGHQDFMLVMDEPKFFKPVHRLVAAVAYALKEEQDAGINSLKEEKVIVAGDEYFHTKKELRKAFKDYQDPALGCFYHFEENFVYLLLSNNKKIRSCFTRCLDAPSDIEGHVQTLDARDAVTKGIRYFEARSP